METIRWREWSTAAFADAVRTRKPVLLSIVTAWSEECAAMDASTFSDAEVVDAASERYVLVRVDADRRPDINERYNLGGWPTTSALTPGGDVLDGATYLGPREMVNFLRQTADAWRDHEIELGSRPTPPAETRARSRTAADTTATGWFRSVVAEAFDPEHGGFTSSVKLPHPLVIRFAVALAAEDHDEAMQHVAEKSLIGVDKLWDLDRGGFYRYAGQQDWTNPGTEKTLEDNAAILEMLVDASVRLGLQDCRYRAGDLARWVTHSMADQADGGFFNSRAAVSQALDSAMYVDRNAEMIGASLRASLQLDDPWLRDFALKSFETVVLPGYVPGQGLPHQHVRPAAGATSIRGMLSDQIRTASALIWAHTATGQLPYSMLAFELAQFAVRTMWDETAGCFRDRGGSENDLGLLTEPMWPMALNCDAACVLDRLALLTGDATFHDRAVSILASFADEYRRYGLFAAPYALAVREVTEQRRPPGLNLSRVEWHLEHD